MVAEVDYNNKQQKFVENRYIHENEIPNVLLSAKIENHLSNSLYIVNISDKIARKIIKTTLSFLI